MNIAEFIEFEYQKRTEENASGEGVSADIIRDILTKYMDSPAGRDRIAQSLVQPSKAFIEGRRTLGPRLSHEKALVGANRLATRLENFLSVVPEEEKAKEPYPQLGTILDELKSIRDECSGQVASTQTPPV
jgi:hypothetical protein